MSGATTKLIDPEAPNDEPKSFTFDYSYWSHDGFAEDETGYLGAVAPNYADQRKVYNDVGQSVLNNAWDGYNSTLFAYGQTGSGKSWSIVGYGANKGIVPIFCDEMFKGIQKKKDEGDTGQYEVECNISKNALLRKDTHNCHGMHGAIPYVIFFEIRAHTIVGVTFVQKNKNAAGEETAKTSLINLVDLAGSERADSTGATGDRLKEGAAINQSLSALGNVISALVDKANGQNVRVPYRGDSALTRLLKNALAGNSKTAMIAAISPADINYDETLSTLRYADRAKQIKTTATVNEDPTEKLIRDLQEQNAKLLEKLKAAESGQVIRIDDDDDDNDDDGKMSDEEMAALRKQIEEDIRASMADTEKAVADMNKTWEEKLAETDQASTDKEAQKKERMETPHFWNLNPDSQLTGMIVHLLKKDKVKIGNKKADPPADIQLAGLNVQKEHCEVTIAGDKITITPIGDAKLLINGEPITEEEELEHHDRVMFGSSHLYVFHHPKQADKSTIKAESINYEMAQEEIAQNSGFDMEEGSNKDAMLLQEDLVDLVPMVEEANAISMELDRKVSFEVVVMTAKARGLSEGKSEPYVLMRNLENGLEWLWPKKKFINRKYLMQEMYSNYEEGEDWALPDERDPFTESPDVDFMIGCVEVSMESLGYVLDMREQLNITDFRGKEVGYLNVEVVPLDSKGKEITEDTDLFIDNPRDLIGEKLDFVVRITSARGLPKKYTDVYCSYKLFLDEDPKTEKVSGTSNPDFNYERKFHFDPVNEQFVDYLMKKSVVIQLWGKQIPDKKPLNKAAKEGKDTKAIMKAENMNKGMAKGSKNVPALMNISDHVTMKRRKERLELKINQIRKICDRREEEGHIAVKIADIRAIIGDSNANTPTSNARSGATQPQERRNESSACAIL
ncbi:Kinesin-like protein KIF1A [Exaiptasia diaphana]|nr:Kinesin-like protein KIF1A [Exaiptasia diaphana]